MRELHYHASTSLDGFIASPDGNYSWMNGIPSHIMIHSDTKHTYIMGRKTYDNQLAADGGDLFIENPEHTFIVMSRTKEYSDFPNVTVAKDAVECVQALKDSTSKTPIILVGGGQLSGLLFKEKMVDKLYVEVRPVMIGEGIKMVDIVGTEPVKLELMRANGLSVGYTVMEYKVLYD